MMSLGNDHGWLQRTMPLPARLTRYQGTWEHKVRRAEMEARPGREEEGSGHHLGHLGHHLPPQQLDRFMSQHKVWP